MHCQVCEKPAAPGEVRCSNCGFTFTPSKPVAPVWAAAQPKRVAEGLRGRAAHVRALCRWCAALRDFWRTGEVGPFRPVLADIVRDAERGDDTGRKLIFVLTRDILGWTMGDVSDEALQAIASELPQSIRDAWVSDGGAKLLVKATMEVLMSGWSQMEDNWPYREYTRLSETHDEQLVEILSQTMREGYWLSNFSSPTRRAFLEDEKIRLDSGIYPTEAIPQLRRICAKLERTLKRSSEAARRGQDAEINELCVLIAPMAVEELVSGLQQRAMMTGSTFTVNYSPLDNGERDLLDQLMAGPHKNKNGTALKFLRTRLSALNQVLSQPFDDALAMPFVTAHWIVTAMANHFSRKVVTSDRHKDFPHIEDWMSGVVQESLAKSDPEMALAFFPEYRSLDAINYDDGN
jgi:hypothetical protein